MIGWLCRAVALLVTVATLPGAVAADAAASPVVAPLRVVMDNNYPPYVFRDPSGRLQGVLIDEWRLWEQKTGRRVELTATDWARALQEMQEGKFDVIDTIFKTEERSAWLEFTPSYAKLAVPIFFDRDLSGITDIESLRGFQVGVKAGDAAADLLREHGIGLVLFRNYESIIQAAIDRRIHVFVMDRPPALYYLDKLRVQDRFRETAPVSTGEFHRAVRRENAELAREVQAGFALFTAEERRALDEKWFGRQLSAGRSMRIAFYAIAGAALLILVLFGWNWTLRRVVNQRTTALQESEARFRVVMENLHDVFWMRNVDTGRIEYVSPSYERLWGRSCQSLYDDPSSWQQSVHPDDAAALKRAVTVSEYDVEYRIRPSDGAERWIRDRGFPVRDATGKVVRLVGIATDVTDNRRLEQQILRAQRMEAIGALSSGIAHDLNNILAPIVLSSALLKEMVASEQQRGLVAMIERGAERGADILRQLLIFSRGAMGDRVAVGVGDLLKEMAAIVRETFPRDLVLNQEVEPGLPRVWADPTQLHQVLLNLCVNARDAMPRGGVLTLRATSAVVPAGGLPSEPEAKPGSYVVLEVADTGDGIAPEVLNRIFEPFFTTKPPGKGTGLGLSTALGIVRSHEGFVTVDSEPGKGSRFRVYLPPWRGAEPKTRTGSASPFPRGNGELVVVVDDEEAIRTATALVLERSGYQVRCATDGSEAVALVLADPHAVRVVVTDLMMPGMDGVAVVRAVRHLNPEIRVVVTTGMAQEAHRAELAELGIHDPLPKPCGPRELLAAIRVALDGADKPAP